MELCSKLLEMFLRAGIPVIRLGLNASKELDGSVLAGAYHPALGDMAMARLYRREAEKLLEGRAGGRVVLGVNRKHVGSMVGYRRENAVWFKKRFNIDIKARPADVPAGKIILLEDEKKRLRRMRQAFFAFYEFLYG